MSDENTTRELMGADDEAFSFRHVELRFESTPYSDVFGRKNNKTVRQTLKHRRYAKLHSQIVQEYEPFLDIPLGEFLAQLKRKNDPTFRLFLNKYGDLSYTTFTIRNEWFLNKKGVYAYFADEELKYIGRCKDTMKKRINQGYGKIHPKNCYLDGQATNCHLNASISELACNVSLWLHEITSDEEIVSKERALIGKYKPAWNIQRA